MTLFYLPDSHFLRLPDFVTRFGNPRRDRHPLPPDQAVCQWLRNGAPRLTSRDIQNPALTLVPKGLPTFFSGNISFCKFKLRGQTGCTAPKGEAAKAANKKHKLDRLSLPTDTKLPQIKPPRWKFHRNKQHSHRETH